MNKTALYAGYEWAWCDLCDHIYSICKVCGNNSCNPCPMQQGCKGCEANYEISDKIWANKDETRYIQESIEDGMQL